ncbi:MAG: hypothetical protein M0Z41_06245 [Peptococcaceae bacterium]|nr:hypothetical protein [Peptococcaceae bacterium]
MPRIDTPVKRLFHLRPADWARYMDPDCREEWVGFFQTDFTPRKESRLDNVLEIADPAGPYLLNLEPMGYRDVTLPARMLRYRSDVWEATLTKDKGTPAIRQVVIFFYEDDDNGLHRLRDRWDGGILDYAYTVLRVWEQYRQDVVEARLVGLYPLLPLMKGGKADETPREAMEESIRAVQEVEDEAVRKDLLAVMAILVGGRYSPELVRSMIRREMIMESAVFQEWVKDIVEEKTAEAEAKGRQEAICKFLNTRFGDISRDLQGRVKRIGNVETLDAILDRIFSADLLRDAAAVVDGTTRDQG